MVTRSTLTPDYQRDWPSYFDAVTGQPPRDTCRLALDLFAPSPREGLVAVDLACGEGRDTREILARPEGWRVVAIDSSDDALTRLAGSLDGPARARVSLVKLALEGVADDPGVPARVDLVNASFALPFCRPEAFPALWAWVRRSVVPGGRFAGQFFGNRDEWAPVRPASHVTRKQAELLLGGWVLERFDEVEKEGSDAMGGVKRHHVFHVVARKPS